MGDWDKICCASIQRRNLAIYNLGDLFNFLVGRAFDFFLTARLIFGIFDHMLETKTRRWFLIKKVGQIFQSKKKTKQNVFSLSLVS